MGAVVHLGIAAANLYRAERPPDEYGVAYGHLESYGVVVQRGEPVAMARALAFGIGTVLAAVKLAEPPDLLMTCRPDPPTVEAPEVAFTLAPALEPQRADIERRAHLLTWPWSTVDVRGELTETVRQIARVAGPRARIKAAVAAERGIAEGVIRAIFARAPQRPLSGIGITAQAQAFDTRVLNALVAVLSAARHSLS